MLIFDGLWSRSAAYAGAFVVAGLLLGGGAADVGGRADASVLGSYSRTTAVSRGAFLSEDDFRRGVSLAKAANVEYVKIELVLNITAVKGNIIYAEGQVSGKFKGTASLHLDLVNASRSEATFTAHEPHGTLMGSGPAGYRVSGSVSYFSGGTPSLSGTGKYQKIKDSDVKMTGSMNRRTLKIIIHMTGKLYD